MYCRGNVEAQPHPQTTGAVCVLDIETYRIAGVDVDPVLQILQNLLGVPSPRRSEEGGAVIRLQKRKFDIVA